MRRTLEWRDCVGRRLAHRDCRIYTNSRWGVKVTVHVRTLCQRDLTAPEPWIALESTAKGVRHYREAQARVEKAMRRIYTPKFVARVKGVTSWWR